MLFSFSTVYLQSLLLKVTQLAMLSTAFCRTAKLAKNFERIPASAVENPLFSVDFP